ncbi:MAG: hypothetical protein J1F31_04670 [Erysipelotrichales bacterium]|nr:hypothetical protein [Erysipelotrichales bacterium]
MKKKLLILIPVMLLASCELNFGGYAQECNDNKADFPSDSHTYSAITPKIRESYKYEINNPVYNHEQETEETRRQLFNSSDKSLITDFSFMNSEQANGNENILTYAQNTALKNEANLPLSTRYPKIFDGQISCVGPTANSRLGLYSDGVIIDLHRTLQSANSITLYMTHNYLTLKMKAVFTLYKPTDAISGNEYDEFVFSFYTNLGTSVAGPKFFYFDLTKILEDTSVLKGCNMLGFRYERIELSEEEKQDKQIRDSFTQYYDNLEDEKNHTGANNQTFVKLYDIGIPYSTWSK